MQIMYLIYNLIGLFLPAEAFQTWYIGKPFEKACENKEKDYDYKDWVWKPHAWFKEMVAIFIWLLYFVQTFEWYVMNNLIKEQLGKDNVTIYNERITGHRQILNI